MKKVFALMLVLALALSAAAFAEEAPAEEAAGSPVPFEVTAVTPESLNVIVKAAEEDETATQLLTFITETNDNGFVFGASGVEGVADYDLVELVRLFISGYEEGMGGVTATVKFAAAFEQDAELAVLLGMINGTEVTWQPLEAKVEEDGSLTISLTAEQAKAVQDGVAVIAVLQKAIAE